MLSVRPPAAAPDGASGTVVPEAPAISRDGIGASAATGVAASTRASAPPSPALRRRHRLRWVAAGAAALVLLGSAAWYLRSRTGTATGPTMAVVARRDLSASVVATGTIKAVVGGKVKVGSRIPGRVERLAVQVGDRVKPGQVIATLEQDELRATLEKTRAELAAAEARAGQTEADLTVVRATAETAVARETARLSAARARLKLVLDGARPEEIAQAEAAVRQAEANHRLAEANTERSQRLLDQGLIARQEGETVRRESDVAHAQLRTAHEQLALARARYRPEEVQIARDEVRQAEAGLAEVQAEVGKILVKERELVTAQRQVDQARAAVKAAAAGDRLVRRTITTGWRDKSYTEVLSGVKEGERVAVGEVETAKTTSAPALPPGAR